MTEFETGYWHGHISGQHCTRREAEARFPAWSCEQLDLYMNGRDDGVAGDTFRLNYWQTQGR